MTFGPTEPINRQFTPKPNQDQSKKDSRPLHSNSIAPRRQVQTFVQATKTQPGPTTPKPISADQSNRSSKPKKKRSFLPKGEIQLNPVVGKTLVYKKKEPLKVVTDSSTSEPYVSEPLANSW